MLSGTKPPSFHWPRRLWLIISLQPSTLALPWAAPEGLRHPRAITLDSTHKEELQALGWLSKPRGSTGKHQYLLKCFQKSSSIPRVRVSPKAGAAHKVGLCTSSLMGCSQPERQGSPHEGPHISSPWGNAGRGLPGSGEGDNIPCNFPTMSNLEPGAFTFVQNMEGFAFHISISRALIHLLQEL